jgi:Putative Ig domain
LRIFRALVATIGIAVCFSNLGCGSPAAVQASSEVTATPSISQVLPQTIPVGSTSVTMKVTGTNFTSQTVILWNGGKLATSVVDSNTLAAAVQGGSFMVPGTAQVQVQDSQTGKESAAVPVVIASPGTSVTPLAISTTSVPTGLAGASYSVSLAATGGTPAYTWSISSGQLPSGLSLSASTGIISGTPTASGTFSFGVTVNDAGSPQQSATSTLGMSVTAAVQKVSALVMGPVTLPGATATQAYSATLAATGGTAPYSWSVSSGLLPSGISMSASTGVISGTPTASGTFSFGVTVTDSTSPVQTASASASIVVGASPLALAAPVLPSGTSGAPYSQPLQANGGTPGYTWSITSGSLPAGLTLASTTGVISGTPSASGASKSSFTVTVTDGGNPAQTSSAATSITIGASALTIASSLLPVGTNGAAYSTILQASGGTPGYTWSITSGSLPTGLTLAGTGAISGTPTVLGTSNFTVTATDGGNPAQTKSAAMTIVVVGNTLTITSSTLGSGISGTPYSQALQAGGGTPGYTWSVTSGSLPAGLSLASATGVISGTPTASGAFNFTATITDSGSPAQTKSAATSIVIAPSLLAVSTTTLPSGTNGAAYSQALLANGGTPGYTWSITSGALPTGLTLAAGTGVISGTSTASGTFSFTATVSDSGNPAQTKSVATSIVIAPNALTITSSTLASGTNGTAYSQVLQAGGGTPGYTWSIGSGSLPAGLTLTASTGTISGTPTGSGTSNFTVTVSDSGNPAQTKSVALTIAIAAKTLAVTTSTLPSGTNGTAYSQVLQASGGTPGYTWSISSGSLPTGLTLAAPTGTISGTPTASGTFNFTATITDSGSPVQTKSASLTIVIAASALSVTTSTLPSGTNGTAYSQVLQASGGTPSYTWSISSGTLPTGLALAASTGTLSGTPTASGTFNFTATVTDSGSPVQTKSAALTIVVATNTLTVTTSTLPSGTKGTVYSQALQASGGTPAYTWSITTGSLPTGLTLAASTGTISGSPTASGTFNFTATVTDSGSPVQTKSAALTIVVAASPLAVTTSTLPSGANGTAYSQTLQASGGISAYTWSVTAGSLPAGLTLAASTGLISGTPTGSGTANFTATVIDSSSPAQTKSSALSIVIAPKTLAITTSALSSGTTGTAYSQTLAASGGTTAYTWTVTIGSLPAGLSLAASTGVISGTPTGSGTSNFTVTVTDSGSPVQTKSAAMSIVVTVQTLAITTSTLSSGTNGTAYSQPLQATGGTPAYTWSISTGSLPAGLTLAATTGVISGTPTATGISNFTAMVSDNGTPVQTKSVAISITVVAASLPAGPGTTWYIRPDGGTRYSANALTGQCDGKGDVAYSGSGTNQHCAFNDLRYMWDDQSYANDAWVMAGGDTLIIRGCAGAASPACRVGWDSWTGSGAGYTWCYGGNGYQSCHNPTIPAGTVSQPTRILGQNYASCGTSSVTNRSQLTQIFGGIGVGAAFDLGGAANVQVECLEITRHSQCISGGSPAYPSQCTAGVDDFDDEGITTDANTMNILLQDVWIHGHPDTGIRGPFNGNMICQRCNISYNGQSGWDFDNGSGTPTGNTAAFSFLYSQIEWNGCNQEYPMVDKYPAISCYDQNSEGYGDGIGTPPGECFNVTIDHSLFDYNTQDGIDFGHFNTLNRTDGKCVMSITNSLSYANMGGQWKWGPAPTLVTFTNNLGVANCNRMSAPLSGAPSTYNTNLSLFCRANDGYAFDFFNNSTLVMTNNTFVSYAPTTFDVQCNDLVTCAGGSWVFENNLVVGYANTPYTNYGGNFMPGGICGAGCNGSTLALPPMTRSNNLFYGVRGFSCPTGYSAELCQDPQFVNEPTGTGANFVESELDNFNFTLSSASPAVGAGLNLPSVPLDYTGAQRANPPSIGAYEQ